MMTTIIRTKQSDASFLIGQIAAPYHQKLNVLCITYSQQISHEIQNFRNHVAYLKHKIKSLKAQTKDLQNCDSGLENVASQISTVFKNISLLEKEKLAKEQQWKLYQEHLNNFRKHLDKTNSGTSAQQDNPFKVVSRVDYCDPIIPDKQTMRICLLSEQTRFDLTVLNHHIPFSLVFTQALIPPPKRLIDKSSHLLVLDTQPLQDIQPQWTLCQEGLKNCINLSSSTAVSSLKLMPPEDDAPKPPIKEKPVIRINRPPKQTHLDFIFLRRAASAPVAIKALLPPQDSQERPLEVAASASTPFNESPSSNAQSKVIVSDAEHRIKQERWALEQQAKDKALKEAQAQLQDALKSLAWEKAAHAEESLRPQLLAFQRAKKIKALQTKCKKTVTTVIKVAATAISVFAPFLFKHFNQEQERF